MLSSKLRAPLQKAVVPLVCRGFATHKPPTSSPILPTFAPQSRRVVSGGITAAAPGSSSSVLTSGAGQEQVRNFAKVARPSKTKAKNAKKSKAVKILAGAAKGNKKEAKKLVKRGKGVASKVAKAARKLKKSGGKGKAKIAKKAKKSAAKKLVKSVKKAAKKKNPAAYRKEALAKLAIAQKKVLKLQKQGRQLALRKVKLHKRLDIIRAAKKTNPVNNNSMTSSNIKSPTLFVSAPPSQALSRPPVRPM